MSSVPSFLIKFSAYKVWICGCHFISLPKVWRKQTKPSLRSSLLYASLALDLSVWVKVKFTALNRRERRCRYFLKNFLNSGGIVKTNCRCLIFSNFEATLDPILSLYFLSHLGQILDLQVKPWIWKFSQFGHSKNE